MRWLLVALLDPADRRAVLEREIEHAQDYARMLHETAEQLDAMDEPPADRRPPPAQVMLAWLREQLDAAAAEA